MDDGIREERKEMRGVGCAEIVRGFTKCTISTFVAHGKLIPGIDGRAMERITVILSLLN